MLSFKECAAVIGYVVEIEDFITKWAVDSRLCVEGCLFIALKGEQTDGHRFLEEAAKKGALGAIVSKSYQGDSFNLKLLAVEDPLEALHALAKYYRIKQDFVVIGVTGSVGKTTVKEFTYGLLSHHLRASKTYESYNGQIGLPLSILNAKDNSQVLVLEMGMDTRGEMAKLVQIAEPSIVVISKIAAVHVGFFKDVEEIAFEKAQILTSKCLKVAYIHEMALEYKSMQAQVKKLHCPWISYGLNKGQFYLSIHGEKEIEISQDGQVIAALTLPFEEKHLQENFLAAALVAREFEMSFEAIEIASQDLKPHQHRFEKHHIQGVLLIDDTYNSNPLSMKTVLNQLSSLKSSKRLIGVIGEMADLGDHAFSAHEELGFHALDIFDQIFCYGPLTDTLVTIFKNHDKKAELFTDHQTLSESVLKEVKDGDVLFVKGRNKNQLWKVVTSLKEHLLNRSYI